MNRPFRILWIDDDVYEDFHAQTLDMKWQLRAFEEQTKLIYELSQLSGSEFFVARDVEAKNENVWAPSGSRWLAQYISPEQEAPFGIDLLILDLGGIGNVPAKAEEKMEKEQVALDPGIEFFSRLREDGFMGTVVIHSKHDQTDLELLPDKIKTALLPEIAGDVGKLNSTFMLKKGPDGQRRIFSLARSLSDGYSRGFSLPFGRTEIELAACHNEPVMILGETGTGKENIARSIHDAWAWRRAREAGNGATADDYPFVVINCAGLSVNTARAELMGHVRESFTGANTHQIGAVLKSCGCNAIRERSTAPDYIDQFERELVSENEGLLVRDEDTQAISFRENGPFGTLFLDEFGDLPLDVQTLLLRYLSGEGEVQPFGYPGRILGANVRIIAATSDPRIADLAGIKDGLPSHRSKYEQERPVRADLIFRLKGHVLTSPPVPADKERIKAIIEHFVHMEKSPPTWVKDAYDALAEKILEILNQPVDKRTHIFGHYREISKVVRMANMIVRNGQEVGLRNTPREVNAKVIGNVWRPSRVPMTVGKKAAWNMERFSSEKKVKEGDWGWHVLAFLMQSAENGSPEQSHQQIQAHLKEVKNLDGTTKHSGSGEPYSSLNNFLTSLKGSPSKPSLLRDTGWRCMNLTGKYAGIERDE